MSSKQKMVGENLSRKDGFFPKDCDLSDEKMLKNLPLGFMMLKSS